MITAWAFTGKNGIKTALLTSFPIMILTAVINPLFNHRGQTVLFGTGTFRVTLEAVLYGLVSGAVFMTVILLCICAASVVDGEKIGCIIGRPFPKLALLISMIINLIPRFAREFKEVSAIRTLSEGKPKSFFGKLAQGIAVFASVLASASEKSAEKVTAMYSRGYGMKKKSRFSFYRFKLRDAVALAVIIALTSAAVAVTLLYDNSEYFPKITFSGCTVKIVLCFILFALPFINLFAEEIKWNMLK